MILMRGWNVEGIVFISAIEYNTTGLDNLHDFLTFKKIDMEGVFDLYNLKVGNTKEKGVAAISAFEVKREKNPLYHMRLAMDGFPVYDGKYIKLHVDGQLMMSDTDMEKSSNRAFVRNANGDVLIAGLGIGLVVKNILSKMDSGEIKSITIVEKYKDVIDLVSPYFKKHKIKYICADILKWRPEKGKLYDTIYFDIWPAICTDNLDEIKFLHNIFKHRLNRKNPNCWMDSWMKSYLQSQKRKSRTSFYW